MVTGIPWRDEVVMGWGEDGDGDGGMGKLREWGDNENKIFYHTSF